MSEVWWKEFVEQVRFTLNCKTEGVVDDEGGDDDEDDEM